MARTVLCMVKMVSSGAHKLKLLFSFSLGVRLGISISIDFLEPGMAGGTGQENYTVKPDERPH